MPSTTTTTTKTITVRELFWGNKKSFCFFLVFVFYKSQTAFMYVSVFASSPCFLFALRVHKISDFRFIYVSVLLRPLPLAPARPPYSCSAYKMCFKLKKNLRYSSLLKAAKFMQIFFLMLTVCGFPAPSSDFHSFFFGAKWQFGKRSLSLSLSLSLHSDRRTVRVINIVPPSPAQNVDVFTSESQRRFRSSYTNANGITIGQRQP